MSGLPTDPPPPYPFPPRNAGFCRGMKLWCRHGHVVDTDMRAIDGGHFRCSWKAGPGGRSCGEFIVFGIFPKPGGGRRLWAADITAEELRYFEAMYYDLDQMMAYLGAMRRERRAA